MKKIYTILALAGFCVAASAQDNVQQALEQAAQALQEVPESEVQAPAPKYWEKSLAMDLGFNQTSLTNWAAGGYNSLTLSTGLDGIANYKKDLTSWKNRLQLNYAFLWSADKTNLLQKSADRMYFESAWSYKTSESSKWNYSASFDFRSQFSDTKDKYVQDPETKKWDGTLKSGLFSPAYTNIALGMAWKPNAWFDVSISPLTGGFTICTNDILRPNYGMKMISEEPAKYASALFQFGAQIKANGKWTINDVFAYETQLVLFTDYLDKPFRQVRVNWDNKISWQLSKFFKISANTWMIYDPIVLIKDDAHPEGIQRVQFKEFLSFSFTYTFKPRS